MKILNIFLTPLYLLPNLTIADFPLGLGESNSNLSWLLVIKNLKYYM